VNEREIFGAAVRVLELVRREDSDAASDAIVEIHMLGSYAVSVFLGALAHIGKSFVESVHGSLDGGFCMPVRNPAAPAELVPGSGEVFAARLFTTYMNSDVVTAAALCSALVSAGSAEEVVYGVTAMVILVAGLIESGAASVSVSSGFPF
jgi:hypothetical protein